ncbi:hypothetical protein [Phyllobacterium leguminum]|uniref:Uncharacterized protein n=1 Tax=Phyllobacterium leguminum TaxID=314237 RepID=A0A318T0W4_9HYPH|nr:hypothetical protein [Phyllobacterium leguminum]PYE87340.1 hypothetical protein C7477_11475 [Phyllobacterium leguminum]
MKNITISMDDELAQRIRVAAAKAGKSVSRYMAEAGREKVQAEEPEETGRRGRQWEALQKIFSGPQWDVTEDGRMPTAEERNARR